MRLLLALLLARPGLVSAANFYADAAAGNDANNCLAPGAGRACKTLTRALTLANAAASPPHTVHAAPGLYDDAGNGEAFPLTPGDGVGLLADSGAGVTTISQVALSTAAILYNRSMTLPASVILDGFTISDSNGGAGADAVAISPQGPGAVLSPVIRNNRLSAVGNAGIRANGGFPTATVSPQISGNLLAGSGGNGVLLNGTATSSPLIQFNTFTSNGGSGLILQGAFSTAPPPVVKNNRLSGNGSPEVRILATSGEVSPVFSSNTILAQGTTVGMLVSGNSNIDLGGGALGGVGHNTIRGAGGSYDLDFSADPNHLAADYNWWTDFPPAHNNNGAAGVDVSTALSPALSFQVDHTSGPLSGGTVVTITAADANTAFVDDVGTGPARISVLVGGSPATSVQVNAAGTQLAAVTPSGAPGSVSILIRNPAGQLGSGTNSRGFTYVAAPQAPASLAATALGVSSIAWSWASVSGATGYFFYPSTGGAAIYSTSTAVVLVGLSSNTAYGARVSAVNVGGEGAKTAAASAFTMAGPVASQSGAATTATLNPPTGPVTVSIPPGAFSAAVSVTLSAPSAFPGGAGASLVGTGVGVKIDLDQALQPSLPVPIMVSFRDSDAAGLDKTTLLLARYDESSGTWVPLESTVDTAGDIVTALTRHFSIFQIMASSPAQDLSAARVIPNPFLPNKGQIAMGFFNLPPFAAVRLYTPAGLLIRSLTANAAGLAVWDGNNQAGAKAASGVYYALVQAVGKSRTLTVAIER